VSSLSLSSTLQATTHLSADRPPISPSVGFLRRAVFLTGDQTLTYEQNLVCRTIAIVVLSSVELDILKPHLPKIIAAIDNAQPGSFQAVDCGTFNRKK